jgi:hypothetical protein
MVASTRFTCSAALIRYMPTKRTRNDFSLRQPSITHIAEIEARIGWNGRPASRKRERERESKRE